MKPIAVIGKDPVLTMQITTLIGERAVRKAKSNARKALLLSPITAAKQWLRSR